VDVTASLDAPCDASRLVSLVDELTDYPAWMPLVHRVEPAPAGDGGRPRWDVELRARMGPLARSKRLRMERTVHDAESGRIRFERREDDGRRHAAWVLDATVVDVAGAPGPSSRLEMRLHYGGALWTGGVLERVLADQIVAARARLLELVAQAE